MNREVGKNSAVIPLRYLDLQAVLLFCTGLKLSENSRERIWTYWWFSRDCLDVPQRSTAC